MKLKKGSAAAKAYMAKLRAARGKTKPKAKAKAKAKKTITNVGASKRTTEDVWVVYGYYANGKEIVYTAYNFDEAKSILKDYKNNDPGRKYTIGIKRQKIGAYKKPVLFKPTKKQTTAAAKRLVKETMHKDTKSHNVNIRVMSGNKNIEGLKKLSGVAPHKAKYFIEFMYEGIERTEYFDKLPADRYKGMNGIIYLTRLTDYGTTLIPLTEAKTNKPVKK